jgi:hypothetical protein
MDKDLGTDRYARKMAESALRELTNGETILVGGGYWLIPRPGNGPGGGGGTCYPVPGHPGLVICVY